MNELEYIKEDLKKANITNYSIEQKHIINNIPDVISCSNAIIYVYYLRSKSNETLLLKSFDFNYSLQQNKTNESILKYLNDIILTGVRHIKYIKVNFIKETEPQK